MKTSLRIILNREDDKKVVVTLQDVKQGLTTQDLTALKSLIQNDKIFKDGELEISGAVSISLLKLMKEYCN